MNVGCAELLTLVFCRLGPFFKITLFITGKDDTWLLLSDQKSYNWNVQGNWQHGKCLGFVRLKGE